MSAFSDTLVSRLARANRVAVLTGAGISAESGIPTFRDPNGLWEEFSPEELANVNAFLENTELVQGWYHHRLALTQEKEPNPGHHALVELEEIVPECTIITQNVDDLHHRAGSENIIELHGNITRSYCIDCEAPADHSNMESLAEGEPATCTDCGGYIRPDVVWFGEALPEGAFEKAHQAAARADVCLSIGTSAVVFPAARIPLIAMQEGAYVAEINIKESSLASQVDEVVLGKAGEILPELIEDVREHQRVSF